MEEKNGHTWHYPMATLAAVLLFVAATFRVADGNMLLGVVFFGAASCFSSLAGAYREREKRETIGVINHIKDANQ